MSGIVTRSLADADERVTVIGGRSGTTRCADRRPGQIAVVVLEPGTAPET